MLYLAQEAPARAAELPSCASTLVTMVTGMLKVRHLSRDRDHGNKTQHNYRSSRFERLEQGYPTSFGLVYFSRGTLHEEKKKSW